MVHRPTRVGTVRDCLLWLEQSLPVLIKCSDGWHCQVLMVLPGVHGDLADHHLCAEPDMANRPMMAWMFPGGDLRYLSCMQ